MRRLGLSWTIAFCLIATGCRHKQPAVVAIALPPSAPVPLDKAPDSPMVPPVPTATAPLPAVVVKARKPKKPRRKLVPVTPSMPVQVAGLAPAAPSAENVIGSLSAGGGDSAAKRQQAADLLAAVDKRLAALPPAVVEGQRDQLQRVRHFSSDARAALNAGDADGAWTLATKAKVLLDDVMK